MLRREAVVQFITVLSGLVLVSLIAYCTYFYKYEEPAFLFWDENYHIASAEKYLTGIHFMEPHPPLGKLIIAAGEAIFRSNPQVGYFNDSMYIERDKLPKNFSFVGYRFFPALLATLSGPIFFLVLYLLTGSGFAAVFLSALYLFDNALIVHLRGAMLESPQLFFLLCFTLIYLLVERLSITKRNALIVGLALGGAFGLEVATKVNGLILILFLLPLLYKHRRAWSLLAVLLSSFVVAFGTVVGSVWYTHFALARTLNPALEDQGYFSASEQYRAILDGKQNFSPLVFPAMLKDSLGFFKKYERGVPKLNLCKENENGSPSFLWPFGGRTINYRWESEGDLGYRYLYLVSNPFNWLIGLTGVVLAGALLLSDFFSQGRLQLLHRPQLLLFSGVYWSYMLVMARIERVMYLYHYFIPLLLSYFLFALVFKEIQGFGRLKLTQFRRILVLGYLALGSFFTFRWFAPLTYYGPINNEALGRHALASIWDLTCVGCPRTNKFAFQASTEQSKPSIGHMLISGLAPFEGEQQWGEPQYGLSVDRREATFAGLRYQNLLGVHARSVLKYPLRFEYAVFEGKVGLPDYLEGTSASVVFEILGNGQPLWRSNILRAGMEPEQFRVELQSVDVLELRVEATEDGNTDDHGCWLEPKLVKAAADKIEISGVPAFEVLQDWGRARNGLALNGTALTIGGQTFVNGFGVHALSKLRFKLDRGFAQLKFGVGLPDYAVGKGGSVVFEVWGDDRLLWSSGVIKAGALLNQISVAVSQIDLLELRVTDGGDGNRFDHACWVEPALER